MEKLALLLGGVGSEPTIDVLRHHVKAQARLQFSHLTNHAVVSILASCFPLYQLLKNDLRDLWMMHSRILIEKADTIVFLVNERLFESKGCQWEYNYIRANFPSKPILFYSLDLDQLWSPISTKEDSDESKADRPGQEKERNVGENEVEPRGTKEVIEVPRLDTL